MDIYSNPLDILKSNTYNEIMDAIGGPRNLDTSHNSLMEKIFVKSFWGNVGLSGFTLYPSVLNYFDNKEITKLSTDILNYQIEQVRMGANIKKELIANMALFSLVGYNMIDVKSTSENLALVPKFLFKSLVNFSFEKASIELAKERDLLEYSILHFIISESLALICHYYKKSNHLGEFELNAIKEFGESFVNNLTVLEYIQFVFPRTLSNVSNCRIIDVLKEGEFLTEYCLGISNCNLKEKVLKLISSNKKELIENSQTYACGYAYKNYIPAELSYDKTIEQIRNKYFRFICPSYKYLLESCSMYYDERIHLKVDKARWTGVDKFDQQMVKRIADWVVINRKYECLRGISKDSLAKDIESYIRNGGLKTNN